MMLFVYSVHNIPSIYRNDLYGVGVRFSIYANGGFFFAEGTMREVVSVEVQWDQNYIDDLNENHFLMYIFIPRHTAATFYANVYGGRPNRFDFMRE